MIQILLADVLIPTQVFQIKPTGPYLIEQNKCISCVHFYLKVAKFKIFNINTLLRDMFSIN